jgi:3-(3-hydroxy-phenyl)propionate hydroxylase
MVEHEVLIVGGGPTGLMLAGELALAGIDVAVIERRANQELVGSRAGGLHSRTIEVLDQRGIAERFLSQGRFHKALHFHVPLDVSDLPTRHNYVLGLSQNHIERILTEWIAEFTVKFYREREATSFVQNDAGVDVSLSDGDLLHAQYLVGCDGGRSVVRKSAGIEFAGWDATTSWLIAEADWTQEPEWGFRRDAVGTHAIGKSEDGKRMRVVLTEAKLEANREPTLSDVRETLLSIYGIDFGVHSPTSISRFTDMTRQAVAYRDRRVLLAGDAAHVHPPMGGQGLNIGVQDAVNLGWKLAQVVKQVSSEDLLDTYHAERHPIGARVLRNTMAQSAIRRTDERTKALGEYFSEFLAMDGPRRRLAAEISGLDIHYELGEGHPLLGRRMPDLDLSTANGYVRTFALLQGARAVLLKLGETGRFDIRGWADRVKVVGARYDGVWELPVIGVVAAPTAALIRPDGYVAWVGDGECAGLSDALVRWFGGPTQEEESH